MTRVASSDIRDDFSDILNRVIYQEERIIVQRHGKDVAVLLPVKDLALLEALEDHIDLEDARAALAEAREKGTTSLSSLMDELGISR
jgi:prevent-host-death family protein